MNSISQSIATESKTMREYVVTFDNALLSLREAESKLHEIKYNLDSMVQAFCYSDVRRQKQYKESMKDSLNTMESYKRLEDIIMKNVVPLIKFSRTRVEPARYQKYLAGQNLATSLRIFRDETSTVLQDQTMYKNFKAFREIYKTPERTYFDISYEALLKHFDSLKRDEEEKSILLRFEKSLEYSELPEIFYICYVRVDLITTTLVFRKVPPNLQTDFGKKEDGENGHTEGGKVDKNKVTLINVTYSHIFDGQPPTQFQKKSEPFYLLPDLTAEDKRLQDPEIRELIEVIQQNAHRVSLPVLCSSMSVYQRHTHIFQERLENYVKMVHKTFEKKEQREANQIKILNIIMKQSSEEFMSNLENKCGMCNARFNLDSQYQKLLPPLKATDLKNERFKALHTDCRKIFKRESAAPQIIVEVDCSDDTNTFNL